MTVPPVNERNRFRPCNSSASTDTHNTSSDFLIKTSRGPIVTEAVHLIASRRVVVLFYRARDTVCDQVRENTGALP
jgi:hypothetical protein